MRSGFQNLDPHKTGKLILKQSFVFHDLPILFCYSFLAVLSSVVDFHHISVAKGLIIIVVFLCKSN